MILGTAALGMEYGISNRTGEPDQRQCYTLLRRAWENDLRHLDTAPVYGKAEQVIGDFIKESGYDFTADTKYISSQPGAGQMETSLRESKTRLRCRINTFYLRSLQQYYDPGIREKLKSLKKEREIENAGISVYDPSELEEILADGECIINTVQIPFHLFNASKWMNNGLLNRACESGIRIYARSIYLQGLMFCDPYSKQAEKLNAGIYLSRIRQMAEASGLSVRDYAFSFAASVKEIQDIVIGFETMRQLEENIVLNNKRHRLEEKEIQDIIRFSEEIPDTVTDPRQW